MAKAKAKSKAGAAKKKGGGKAPETAAEVRLAGHPRAQRQIALTKSYAGLGALGLSAYSAWSGGAQFVDVALRSLMWGVATYIVVWALAVQVWRHIAVAEVRAAEKRWKERKDAEAAQVEKLRAALEENGLPTNGTGVMPPA